MKKVMLLKVLMISAAILFIGSKVFAQGDPMALAHAYADSNEYDKAIDMYRQLYSATPNDVYSDYLNVLLKAKEYKEAEKLVNEQLVIQPHNPVLTIDMGRIYEAKGKQKKADEQYEAAIQMLNGDDMRAQEAANAFTLMGKDQYVIRTYEREIALTGNGYAYGTSLARLYAKTGSLDKAVDMLLNANPGQYTNPEGAKALLLELLGDDHAKLIQAQKALIKRINEQPENAYYAELLTWLYTQKNDWDGALIQIEALDERNRENGHRLLQFASVAERAGQYEIAIKADDEVMEKGKDQPLYLIAQGDKLKVELTQLENNYSYTPQDVAGLEKQYAEIFTEFPQYYASDAALDYAMLEAQYANDPQKGIDILQKALELPDIKREFAGQAKLQLGDYYVLVGKVWDASLTYSQVDKEFKEDAMGEEARFRNAKLAYYRGDFTWAQRQLSVLKASTSELIANDALYLSVLITENVSTDSNFLPLQRFAYADLLLFQNKDKDAETLLDSISAAFPQHPLNDDILMLRAKIAEKHRDYTKALVYLKQVYEQYGKDVLGDDAVFKTAEIYEKYLKQNDQAKHFYEQLIIDYPGSTYVQAARQRLQQLNSPALP